MHQAVAAACGRQTVISRCRGPAYSSGPSEDRCSINTRRPFRPMRPGWQKILQNLQYA